MTHDEGRVATETTINGATSTTDDKSVQPDIVEGATTSPDEGETTAKRGGRAVREIVETLLLALVIFLGVRLVVLNFRVDGQSMAPNLDNQEMLLVNRNAYAHFDLNGLFDLLPGEDRDEERIIYPFDPPERGDIIVFNPPVRDPDKPYIKRVIGLPGERITFRDGLVLVNGELLDEPYIEAGITDCERGRNCRVNVEEGEVYVLGDNRDNSSDSRSFGAVEVESIIGKAWFTYWPSDDIGLVPHYDYPEISERPREASLGAVDRSFGERRLMPPVAVVVP